jgi:hypothetical protein
MDKFGVRRMAAVFGLLGFTSALGAVISGHSPVGSVILILVAVNVLVIAHD